MILISNIRANRVNLAQNDVVCGLPSVTAFMGLVGSTADDLGFDRWKHRVTPIIHEVSISDGRTKPEFILKTGEFVPAENPEDVTGDTRFSLLVDLHDDGDTDARDLLDALVGRRFCGGIAWLDEAKAHNVTPDGSAFASCSRGYALFPFSGGPISGGEDGGFMRVADVAFPAERGSRIILPAAIGFRHIEKREEAPVRSGVRNSEFPHIFTCPLTGVIEAMNVRKKELSELGSEDLQARMFTWSYDRNHAVIHPVYSA